MQSGNMDFSQFGGSPSGSGLSQFLGGMFGNSGKPYEAAQEQYQKYGQQGQDVQNPFYNSGVNAIPKFNSWADKMSNPSDFINNLMNQYQQSPWAKFQTQQGTRAANNAASASGLIGSTPLAQANADYAEQISGQDMNQWLQNVLGVNSQYGGAQQNLISGGQNSANALTQLLSQLSEQMGTAAFGQQRGENQDKGDMIGGIVQMLLHGGLG